MAILDIGQLHNRYVRLADRFKSLWTFNQLTASVYRNVLHLPLPYNIDFPEVYEKVRKASDVIQSSHSEDAEPMMRDSERDLDQITGSLLAAERIITPLVLRRFLEQLRKEDKKVIFYLIKFYLYANAVGLEHRDKLDFLFTRIGEEMLQSRGEYLSEDPVELRKQVQSLVSILPENRTPDDEVLSLVGEIRRFRKEILEIRRLEQFTDTGLLDRSRSLKHRLGEQYFHPDVLLALIDLNVTTRRRFLQFYSEEERRLVEDSQRLLENEDAIVRAFGQTNPLLMNQIAQFRELRQEFEESRSNFNVKHGLLADLRATMDGIFAYVHSDQSVEDELTAARREELARLDEVRRAFGDDALLNDYLLSIRSALHTLDPDLDPEVVATSPEMVDVRLEPWEVASFQKLLFGRPTDVSEELSFLYARAAALRLKIIEEATFIAAFSPSNPIEGQVLKKAKDSLDRANSYDQNFVSALHDIIHFSEPQNVHSLYRSRFRLLRVFSGLWLLYDQFT